MAGNRRTPGTGGKVQGVRGRDKMPPGRSYAETTDQPAFTTIFDMNMARRADSFDKCYRAIETMLKELHRSAN